MKVHLFVVSVIGIVHPFPTCAPGKYPPSPDSSGCQYFKCENDCKYGTTDEDCFRWCTHYSCIYGDVDDYHTGGDPSTTAQCIANKFAELGCHYTQCASGSLGGELHGIASTVSPRPTLPAIANSPSCAPGRYPDTCDAYKCEPHCMPGWTDEKCKERCDTGIAGCPDVGTTGYGDCLREINSNTGCYFSFCHTETRVGAEKPGVPKCAAGTQPKGAPNAETCRRFICEPYCNAQGLTDEICAYDCTYSITNQCEGGTGIGTTSDYGKCLEDSYGDRGCYWSQCGDNNNAAKTAAPAMPSTPPDQLPAAVPDPAACSAFICEPYCVPNYTDADCTERCLNAESEVCQGFDTHYLAYCLLRETWNAGCYFGGKVSPTTTTTTQPPPTTQPPTIAPTTTKTTTTKTTTTKTTTSKTTTKKTTTRSTGTTTPAPPPVVPVAAAAGGVLALAGAAGGVYYMRQPATAPMIELAEEEEGVEVEGPAREAEVELREEDFA